MFKDRLSPPIWLSMNCCCVCTFAFGNGFELAFSRAWFASVVPPRIVARTRRRSAGSRMTASQVACEIVTEPNGEPPVGGSKIAARPSNGVRLTARDVTTSGEPTWPGCGSSRSPCRRSRRRCRASPMRRSRAVDPVEVEDRDCSAGSTAGRLDRLAERPPRRRARSATASTIRGLRGGVGGSRSGSARSCSAR